MRVALGLQCWQLWAAAAVRAAVRRTGERTRRDMVKLREAVERGTARCDARSCGVQRRVKVARNADALVWAAKQHAPAARKTMQRPQQHARRRANAQCV